MAQSHSAGQASSGMSTFAWTMALTATFGYSLAPPVTRGAISAGMDPAALLMARMVASILLVGGFVALSNRGRLKIGQRGALIAIGSGAINGIGLMAFFQALTKLESSVASMIFSLNPLVVLLLLALRGERLNNRHGLRLLLGLGGVYLLIGPSGNVDLLGAALVIAAVVLFALQLANVQWFLRDYDSWAVTFYMVLGITLVAMGWWLSRGAEWEDPGVAGWRAVIILSFVSTFLARIAMFWGVRYLGSGQVALTVPLETFLAVLWAVLFLHERLAAEQWLGGLLIVLSMLLAVRRLRIAPRRPRWRNWTRL